MREIKFRAWNRTDKIMEYGVDINLNGEVIEYDYGYYAGSYDYPVMQYTGLKDMDDKEIYEGDVVLTNFGEKVVVRYSCSHAGYIPFVNDGGCGCCSDDHTRCIPKYIKVIGNIYENPELLESESK